MAYATKRVDGRLRVIKTKSALERLKKPEQRTTVKNIVKQLSRGYPEHIKALLSKRRIELAPALLKPYSGRQDIYYKANQIVKFWDDIISGPRINCVKNITDKIWDDFLSLHNLVDLNMPANRKKLRTHKYWYSVLRRKVRKAAFIYSMLTEIPKQYVTPSFLKCLKSIEKKGRYSTDTGIKTYHSLEAYTQYCRCSNYKARAVGIARLAEMRGLSPYLITITPLPEYHRGSDWWQGDTPDQVAKKLTGTFRIFTDILRHAKLDISCIRVVEPQRDGTPHLHLLVFTDKLRKVKAGLHKAFIDNDSRICGTDGLHIKPASDVIGAIGYLLKTLWGPLKYDADHSEEIMAWSKEGTYRRFGITSTQHKLPSVELWDLARAGKAGIHKHKTYSCQLRSGVRGNDIKIRQINDRLNSAADAGDYAEFCLTFWDATVEPKPLSLKMMKTIVWRAITEGSQLRLIYQDNYIINHHESIDSLETPYQSVEISRKATLAESSG